ncbi:radical SAM protein [Methylocapsa aurea]|uniref:radical SAM protein n=1 Tax=Methylocapsa aurea TaxID=663610 RepID=UPI001FDA2FB6|nr:radical SAM protein [Methylocapsa aurea]
MNQIKLYLHGVFASRQIGDGLPIHARSLLSAASRELFAATTGKVTVSNKFSAGVTFSEVPAKFRIGKARIILMRFSKMQDLATAQPMTGGAHPAIEAAAWPGVARPLPPRAKFSDPEFTAKGERRASVSLSRLETLWFNTGTLCNLTCHNCYIESSPRNDRLAYLTRDEVLGILDEAATLTPPPIEIGFTGGEPFLNPDCLGMIEDSLAGGYRVLVLTNAMKPMQRLKAVLLNLNARFPGKLTLRVSLDHYEAAGHEKLRGRRSWRTAIDGLVWLAANRFNLAIAARMAWNETDAATRAGFRALFDDIGLEIDADDPTRLVLFPEMDAGEEAPEISEACWTILGKSPDQMMCASSRMVEKRKGAARPVVTACTLLPYDPQFEMGATLAAAARPVKLNHNHCARFCVLGGASCNPQK